MLLQPTAPHCQSIARGTAIAIALQELTKSIMVCLLVSLPSLACLDGVAQRLPDRSFLNGGQGGGQRQSHGTPDFLSGGNTYITSTIFAGSCPHLVMKYSVYRCVKIHATCFTPLSPGTDVMYVSSLPRPRRARRL